jgi:pimeloyl-ACP methyl ester carboxylesterase
MAAGPDPLIRIAVAAAAVALALVSGATGAARRAEFVTVNGHRLYLECAGAGSPTVVLDAGLGDEHSAWNRVLRPAGRLGTRVCAYDRLGNGRSEEASGTRTLDAAVADLHALPLRKPYLLVGHSAGGLISRRYAQLHPRTAAALVLVEAAPENLDIRWRRSVWRSGGEALDVTAASRALRRAGSLDQRPMVVVVAAADMELPQMPNPAAFPAWWRSQQRRIATLSTNSLLTTAARSDHIVPRRQPALIVEAIRLTLRSLRAHKRLPRCRDTRLPDLGGGCP